MLPQLPSSSSSSHTHSHAQANSQSRNHNHALHIPEITAIILASLTQLDIIHCRGVSHEWRRLFSPFLKLHGLYPYHNPAIKALFEERLRTLGPFVHSLKQVVPVPQDLETIQQTCPRLSHVGLYVQRKQSMHLKALVKFFEGMRDLGSIALFSFDDSMVATLLQALLTYVQPISTTTPDLASSLISTSSTSSSSCSLRKLEIGNASHSLKFARIQWEQVMLVLLKHPEMTSLTLRDAHLCWYQDQEDPSAEDWSRNVFVRAVFGAGTQRQWNGLLDKLGSWRLGSRTNLPPEIRFGEGGSLKGGTGSGSVNNDASSVQFSKMTHLVLDGMRISEELLGYILEHCPALNSLELDLPESTLSTQFWARWLPSCPQLTSIKVKCSSGSVNIDIPRVWSLAPPTLTTFHFASDRRPLTFPELSPSPSFADLSDYLIPRCRGATLVTLALNIGLRIADRGLPYIMTHCRSLQSLVLGIQYFADWEIVNDVLGGGGGVVPLSPTAATQLHAFPPWACGATLTNLELQVFYLPQDLQFDERIHMFMRRLEDLRVLERLSLPLKLLSDLSESQNEEYSGFNFLEHLEQQELMHQQFSTQATLSIPTQELGLTGNTSSQQHQGSSSQQQQQQLLEVQQGACRNVLPPMPSVQEVVLSSSGSFRLQIRMRHLHILMGALSGLTTVWAAPGLCGLDPLPWFKQLHDKLQERYGSRGVALNLGSPAWGE
ncbi:MAG: hypothetical protein J3R72DRAFT_444370 [Linnemannia gamsii]|nr:MAG: hypothetical protein J3R72DRAFT_444370 [Linnemannia gamsii]